MCLPPQQYMAHGGGNAAMPYAHARGTLLDLIRRHRLHDGGVPVMVRQVANDEGWQVAFRPLESLHGFAVVKGATKVMVINSQLPTEYQRMAVAHEMAHDILGHAGPLFTAQIHRGDFHDWMWDRCEREATVAAARILIPLDRLAVGADAEEVAASCGVPVELVETYAQHLRAGMPYT